MSYLEFTDLPLEEQAEVLLRDDAQSEFGDYYKIQLGRLIEQINLEIANLLFQRASLDEYDAGEFHQIQIIEEKITMLRDLLPKLEEKLYNS